MKSEGLLRHYGVSVETVEEAELALEHGGVETIQIIYNMFRFKPADAFFAHARARDVGIIVRVPLASGLLSGAMTRERAFEADDHRAFNRHGEAFDVGETFSGVDFESRSYRRRRSCRRWSPRGRRWRSSRCAGSSCTPPCRW